MKYALLIISVFVSYVSTAQSYMRSWRECFQDTSKYYHPRVSLQVSALDGADNLYTAGFANELRDFYNDSIYLRKYSPEGVMLWEAHEAFKATKWWSDPLPLALTTDKDNNVILSYSSSFIPSNFDAVVCKYTPGGTRLWQTVFDGGKNVDNEQIKKLNADKDGNIYLLVNETDQQSLNYGAIVKFNEGGRRLWYRPIKASPNDADYLFLYTNDATVDSTGNIYITGSSQKANVGWGSQNLFTYKFFANGDSAWKTLYTVNQTNIGQRVMYARNDNSVVVCGNYDSQTDSVLVIKYNIDGTQLWLQTIKTAKAGQTVRFDQSIIDADNNIVVVASTPYATDFTPPLLTKFSPGGVQTAGRYLFKSTTDIGQRGPYRALSLTTDAQNNYYTITNQLRGILIQKFSRDGLLLAQSTEGLDTFVFINYAALHAGSNQSMYVATSYGYDGGDKSCLSSYKLKNMVAADVVTRNEKQVMSINAQNAFVYPNPAHNRIFLPAQNSKGSSYTILMFDALGKQVLRKQCLASQTTIDISTLATGKYVLQVLSGDDKKIYKVVKQ